MNKTTDNILKIIVCVMILLATILAIGNHIALTESSMINKVKNGAETLFIPPMEYDEYHDMLERLYNNPEIYWLNMSSNTYTKFGMRVVKFTKNGNESRRVELEEKTEMVLNMIIKDNMSDAQKVEAIHDWICNNVKYMAAFDMSDQTVIGSILNGKARCAGYAKAFTYMLNQVGVESRVINGIGYVNGQEVRHAWNVIKVDGKPYYYDITWNDDYGQKVWYGMSKEAFEINHEPFDWYEWGTEFNANTY